MREDSSLALLLVIEVIASNRLSQNNKRSFALSAKKHQTHLHLLQFIKNVEQKRDLSVQHFDPLMLLNCAAKAAQNHHRGLLR